MLRGLVQKMMLREIKNSSMEVFSYGEEAIASPRQKEKIMRKVERSVIDFGELLPVPNRGFVQKNGI